MFELDLERRKIEIRKKAQNPENPKNPLSPTQLPAAQFARPKRVAQRSAHRARSTPACFAQHGPLRLPLGPAPHGPTRGLPPPRARLARAPRLRAADAVAPVAGSSPPPRNCRPNSRRGSRRLPNRGHARQGRRRPISSPSRTPLHPISTP